MLKKIIYIILILLSFESYAQEKIPSIDIEFLVRNPSDSLYEYLSNPVLMNQGDVRKWTDVCQKLWKEIEKKEYDENREIVKLYDLLKVNYELFAQSGRWNTVGNILLIRFDEGISPSLRSIVMEEMKRAYFELSEKFKQKMDLNPPQGYIFVWVFDSRQHMSSIFNLSRDVGGLTYLCRFIFLPVEYSYLSSFPFKDIENFYTVFSHELTHAFINSTVGYKSLSDIPGWFNESSAIFLGGDKKVRYSGDTMRTLSKEYSRYYDLFKFLRKKYPEDKIFKLIYNGIVSKNPDHHFSQLTGYTTYEQFLKAHYTRYYIKLALVGIIVITVLILLFLIMKSVGYRINPVSYILFIILVVVVSWIITGLLVFNIQTKILFSLLTASLIVYSLIELKFYFKINDLNKEVEKTDALNTLESIVFFCLDKYRFSSLKKRNRLYTVLQKTIYKALHLYKEKGLDIRCKNFFTSVGNYIQSSPNLKESLQLTMLLERCHEFISENF